mgnify:CR=1 FL=1
MLNKVFLIGRLGMNPEIKTFEIGSKVCNFSIATSERYKDKAGEKVEQTEWHNIAIWREGLIGVAEKYLKKGSQIHIEGKLRTRSWETTAGEKRYSTEIIVDSFKMLDSKSEATTNVPPAIAADAPKVDFENPDDDDLPF